MHAFFRGLEREGASAVCVGSAAVPSFSLPDPSGSRMSAVEATSRRSRGVLHRGANLLSDRQGLVSAECLDCRGWDCGCCGCGVGSVVARLASGSVVAVVAVGMVVGPGADAIVGPGVVVVVAAEVVVGGVAGGS